MTAATAKATAIIFEARDPPPRDPQRSCCFATVTTPPNSPRTTQNRRFRPVVAEYSRKTGHPCPGFVAAPLANPPIIFTALRLVGIAPANRGRGYRRPAGHSPVGAAPHRSLALRLRRDFVHCTICVAKPCMTGVNCPYAAQYGRGLRVRNTGWRPRVDAPAAPCGRPEPRFHRRRRPKRRSRFCLPNWRNQARRRHPPRPMWL